MITLSTTEKLEIVLAGAVAANQLDCHVGYIDTSSDDPNNYIVQTNSTTPVDLLASPGSEVRQIYSISVYNADTATATVTINTDASSVNRLIVKRAVPAGSTLTYEHGVGWNISFVNNGSVMTSGTPVALDFARFTDENTIEGRSYAEVLTDLSLDDVTTYPNGLRDIVMVMSFQSTFMTSRSATDDLLETVNELFLEWEHDDATLISVKQQLVADDTGASNGTIQIDIAGTNALSSALTLDEVEASGTVDTGNDDVVAGNRIKVEVVTTGSNSDAEGLTIRMVWRLK